MSRLMARSVAGAPGAAKSAALSTCATRATTLSTRMIAGSLILGIAFRGIVLNFFFDF